METTLEIPTAIRRVGRAHISALQTLKEAVIDATWGREFPTESVEAWKRRFASPAYFLDRLVTTPDRPLTQFFVTGPPEAPHGMVALKVRDGRAYIGDLYVRVQRRGLGHRLLKHAEAEADALGLTVAVADVFDGNEAAYRLLVSDGFAEEDEYIEQSLGIRVLRLSRSLLRDRSQYR